MKNILLVGGGHAHLPALRQASVLARCGARVTLVAPDPHHYYSGMGPGILGGIYHPRQTRVAVGRLIQSRGGHFVRSAVARIDPDARTVTLTDGRTLPFDLASFNTGSRVPVENLSGAHGDRIIPVKPIENLVRARRLLLEGRSGPGRRVLVVGGGPAGVELAANLIRLDRAHSLGLRVTVVDQGERLLARMPERAARIATRVLVSQGVTFRPRLRLASLDRGDARSATGEHLPFDLAFLTLGIEPHTLYADSGLPTAPDGGLRVDRHLQAVGLPGLFGGGDCVSFDAGPLPRVGVYAIRQGPVLYQNLLFSLTGEPLAPFRPQKRTLLILNLGDGTGLVVWGPWVWRGRLGSRWKNHLDTTFMERFQRCGELQETDTEEPWAS